MRLKNKNRGEGEGSNNGSMDSLWVCVFMGYEVFFSVLATKTLAGLLLNVVPLSSNFVQEKFFFFQ